MSKRKWQLLSVSVVLVVAFFALSGVIQAQIQSTSTFRARDPGLQSGTPGTGRPIDGLTIDEREMFDVGLEDFAEEEGSLTASVLASTSWAARAATVNPPSGARAPR